MNTTVVRCLHKLHGQSYRPDRAFLLRLEHDNCHITNPFLMWAKLHTYLVIMALATPPLNIPKASRLCKSASVGPCANAVEGNNKYLTFSNRVRTVRTCELNRRSSEMCYPQNTLEKWNKNLDLKPFTIKCLINVPLRLFIRAYFGMPYTLIRVHYVYWIFRFSYRNLWNNNKISAINM